jgi:hypothetical protein
MCVLELNFNKKKHILKETEDIFPIPLTTSSELRCSRRVGNSCSTSGNRRVSLVTNPVISHELGKDTTDSSN